VNAGLIFEITHKTTKFKWAGNRDSGTRDKQQPVENSFCGRLGLVLK
jgi:hypothetical protein